MDRLHKDLVTIHGDLVAFHRTAHNIDANIRRVHNSILLDSTMAWTMSPRSLQSINRDMNAGFQLARTSRAI